MSNDLSRTARDTINPPQLFIPPRPHAATGHDPKQANPNPHVPAQQPTSRHKLSLIKEKNSWISKGMCVPLFDAFKHLLLRKTDAQKTCQKSKFLGSKIGRNALALKSGKRLLSEFLRKWGGFQGHNVRFSKYFGEKFLKNETRFHRWKSTR